MSIWNYVFDNEWSQRSDIEALKRRSRVQQRSASRGLSRTRQKVSNLEDRLDELEEQVGSLQLMNRALLKMLREGNGWDEEQFCRLLHEIDLSDGRQDGKLTGKA